MFNAKRIKAHVYIENVEIDFINITILEQKGGIPKATVSIPPVQDVFNLLPKTVGIVTIEVEKRDIESGALALTTNGDIIYDEVVIFFGELMGTGLSRAAGSSEVQLMFDGFLNTWDTSSIIPVDSSIPTGAEAVMLGINYLDLAAESNAGMGILYNRFPTMLLSFVDLFNSEEGTTDEQKKTRQMVEASFPPDGGREVPKKKLSQFWGKAIPKLPACTPRGSGRAMQDALAVTTRHFLLHYGAFTLSQTKSVLLDGMINYVGSSELQKVVANSATVGYLKSRTRALVTEGTMSVSAALRQIITQMNYVFQEFAAPVLTVDSLQTKHLIGSKVLFHPVATMLSPIANNVFFDDDMISMNASRAWANEPTRLIYMGDPLMTSGTDSTPIMPMLLAIVAPSNIVAHEAMKKLADTTTAALDLLQTKLTSSESAEELMASVVDYLQTQEQTIGAIKSTEDADDFYGNLDKYINSYKKALEDGSTDVAATRKLWGSKGVSILGLTKEEIIRGVVSATERDTFGIEQSFLLTVLNGAGNTKTNAQDLDAFWKTHKGKNLVSEGINPVGATAKAMNIKGDAPDTEPTKLLMKYYVQFANLHYQEKRRESRSLQAQVVYSPYRVCGASSLILLKDIGPVTGVITANQVSISAQGETAQSLTFSHISILNLINEIGTFADALDNYSDDLPRYLQEFTVDKVGKSLYVYMNGRSNSSVYDFCTGVLKMTPAKKKGETTLECAKILLEKYNAYSDYNSIEAFTYCLGQRRFFLFKELMAMLKCKDVAWSPRNAYEVVNDATAPRPFVKERQNAVLAIFKTVNPKIHVWEGN